MATPKSYIEISHESVKVFTDDGTLDLHKLVFPLGIALRDGVIDDDEKRVLGWIFKEAEKGRLEPRVPERIAEVRRKHAIPA